MWAIYRGTERTLRAVRGSQVAKLAGLPSPVIKRARAILESLESGNTAALGLPDQLDLFAPKKSVKAPKVSAVEDELNKTDPDALNPREAHELLYRLVELNAKEKNNEHDRP